MRSETRMTCIQIPKQRKEIFSNMSLYDTSAAMCAHTHTPGYDNNKAKKKERLPFVQQVVFQSLFHLEDEVPKAVHRHGSDEHSSIVPYLKNNENNNHINNNGDKNRGKNESAVARQRR